MIEIKEENKEKIDKMISEAEGKSYARTIDFYILMDEVGKLAKHYHKYHKYAMEGLRIRLDWHAQDLPNAYKWTAKSTHMTLVYRRGHWCLKDAWRDTLSRPKERYVVANMPKALLEEIIASEHKFEEP